jgi:hypothetical protein
MKINKIEIRNILGISELDIEPGSITEVSGENGAGKTSVLDAIRCALSGGTDATLLRAGAESGEVVLLLDDGTRIDKRITAEKSTVSVVHPEFGRLTKPAQYLAKLADALSLNPIAFLTADKKSRVDVLLRAIPMTIAAEQLAFVPAVALSGINLDDHALKVLGIIGKALYDLRTGVNRAEKEKRATANQMAETLPADAPDGDWKASRDQISANMRTLQKSTTEKVTAVKAQAALAIADYRKLFQEHKDAVNDQMEEAIEKIRADTAIEIARSEAARDVAIKDAEANRDFTLEELKAGYEPKQKEFTEALARANAMVEQHAKAETTRKFIDTLTRESDGLDVQSKNLTAALSKLDVLKASLLQKLPIEGLEIIDGDIRLGGLPFDRVNESKRIRLAIEISKLHAGSLGLVAVDGLERLDAKTFEAFKRQAEKSGLQFVISRVSEGPLSIETSTVTMEERTAILAEAI